MSELRAPACGVVAGIISIFLVFGSERGLAWFGFILIGALFIIATHQKGIPILPRDASWLSKVTWGAGFYDYFSFILGFGAVLLVDANI